LPASASGHLDAMLREGPVPRLLHGLLQYALGAFLVAAPFLFAYDSGAATAASIVAGVLVLTLAATSEGPTGLSKAVPLAANLVLLLALSALFVAAPFLFGFSGEGAPTAVFIIAGIVQLLLTIATRFQPAERKAVAAEARRGRRRRRRGRAGAMEPAGTAEPAGLEPPPGAPGDRAGTPGTPPPDA
jgi:hypothetical protein